MISGIERHLELELGGGHLQPVSAGFADREHVHGQPPRAWAKPREGFG